VVSVTSEVSASTSLQNAQARSARPDPGPSAGNDSFAALVDSNAAASANDNRAQDTSSNDPRRADGPGNRSRDNTAAPDKTPRNDARGDSNDRDTAASARDDANADTNDATAKAGSARRSKSKSDASKSGNAKSGDAKTGETKQASKASSGDDASATDQTAGRDGAGAVAADAIAVAIPATAAPATGSPAAPAADKSAPLAIAAAAIAASTSAAHDTSPAATDTSAEDGTGGTDASATPAASANAKADGAKTATGAVAARIITSADAPVTTGVALAASVVATTPAATKAAPQAKNPIISKENAAMPGDQDGTTDTSASSDAAPIVPAAAPQTETANKPKIGNGIVDAVKGEASGNPAHAATAHAASNAHTVVADAGQMLADSSGNGLLGAGTIQTQQPSAQAPPAATPQLSVTASTNAAVPLSGLAMEIAASARSGKSRFEIRLDPAELGRIDVRIDVDRNGQVTSHLTVERPETLSMLRQDANQLQRALDNAGLSTGNGGLQFSLRDQSSRGQYDGSQSNPNAHRLVVSEDDSVPAVVAGRSYGRALGSSGGVDIRI
jgi:flagellar hook-length control protein FliK